MSQDEIIFNSGHHFPVERVVLVCFGPTVVVEITIFSTDLLTWTRFVLALWSLGHSHAG